MRTFVRLMWRAIAASLLIAGPALAQEEGTAYEALRVIGTQLNRAYINRVISVTGLDGNPQPETWRVLVADRAAPGGVREIEVTNNQIVADETPTTGIAGSAEGATIQTSRLNLDSSGAFTVASHTAEKSHTSFALVSYTLRNNDRGYPVWILTLQNEGRQPVGTIHIAANKGNVTRVEGMYRGADMASVQQDRGDTTREEEVSDEEIDKVDEDEEDENAVKREIKKMFRRTKRDARLMFKRVSRSFDEFFRER